MAVKGLDIFKLSPKKNCKECGSPTCMELENNKEEVPFAHYEALFEKLKPEAAPAPFDGAAFCLTLLGERCRIAWPDYAITADDPGAYALSSLPAQTFLLRFLLEGAPAGPFTEYKTFRELPWGEMYITPYTGRVLKRAAFTFGGKLPQFRAACEALGAVPVPHGDAGYRFELLPGYFMMLLGKNATVTVCHTKTVDLPAIARRADILVSAAGVLNSLTKNFVRPGQIVIDVSINWDPSKKDGKGGIAGDAVFSEVEPIVEAVTPVPGGVGTVTSSVLIGHVVRRRSAPSRKTEKKEERNAMNLFTPAELAVNYSNAGAAKTKLPVSKMLLLGILAGMSAAWKNCAACRDSGSSISRTAGRKSRPRGPLPHRPANPRRRPP